MPARVPVTFSPAGVTVWVASGSTVLAAARAAGVLISAPCGGRGVCGSCAVRVLEGVLEPPDDLERAGLSSAPQGVRLACRARVASHVVLSPVVNQSTQSSVRHSASQVSDLVAGVDLGTTTVGAVIIARATGMELGRATVPNAQQSYGSDVLSRISASMDGAGAELATAAERSILQALESACGHAGACLKEVRRLVIAANSAMMTLVLQADPASLATAPFELPDLPSPMTVGLLAAALPNSTIEFAPPIAAFVGGDASAGLLAAGMLRTDAGTDSGPEILVDMGTNAEIVAVSRLGITAASAPAGPAFEGFGISSGGAWARGAVEYVSADGSDLLISVAGGGPGEFVSGSGLIGAIATLLRAGHLAPDGRMLAEGPWSDRFSHVGEVLAFSLSAEGTGGPFIMQTDVRAFQMAQAAVATALTAVLSAARIKIASVERVVVGGGFGSAVRPDDLIELGILPQELAGRIELAGNTALLGAAMLAFDESLAPALRAEIANVTHLDLAADPGFSAAFLEHLSLEPFRFERHGFFRK